MWRGFHDEEVALEMKAPRTRFADEELEHGQGKVKGTHSMGEERRAFPCGSTFHSPAIRRSVRSNQRWRKHLMLMSVIPVVAERR